MEKITVNSFLDAKKKNKKITMLTAYDYTTAKLMDESGIDSILVGDTLGMIMLGYENTLKVTVDDMVHHCRAVSRGTKRAMVIGDMPFLSYHVNIEESIRNAGRIVQEGNAQAVKLEGGIEVIDKVKGIIAAKIPVMGHLGLTPQSINMFGGYKVQGKEEKTAKRIIDDALILQEAGVFAIVLECIPNELVELINARLDIPTIGIGAGKNCDGQVLVAQDMLGMYTDLTPKFVKRFADVGDKIREAVGLYCQEVREGIFPQAEHSYTIKKEVIERIVRGMEEAE